MAGQTGAILPNETQAYRVARDALLLREVELRALSEAVAKERRALPLGGLVPQDYKLRDAAGEVRFSELFAPHSDTLVVYSLMYGPDDTAACPMCTAFLDGLNGDAPHLSQRVNLAVTARASAPKLRDWAEQRGWTDLRLVSTEGTSFNRDYRAENAKGHQVPVLNVFSRIGDEIRHRYLSEMLFSPNLPGMDPRHVDAGWALWNILDLTPEGRSDWYPKIAYR